MDLKIGMKITAETVHGKVTTGEVLSILERSSIIEDKDGRNVVRKRKS